MKALTEQNISKIETFFKRLFFPILGIASVVWFLIRVIPKPSRATYPCMRVAFPIASSFVVWLAGLVTSAAAFNLAQRRFRKTHYFMAVLFLVIGLGAGFVALVQFEKPANAEIIYRTEFPANEPMGEAKGIFPGRVVWSWHPDATNENQKGTDDGNVKVSEKDDYYFLIKNNNQAVIDGLMQDVVIHLTGAPDLAAAWQALFQFHNLRKSAPDKGYTPGEKIFIKINATSINQGDGGQVWHNWEPSELTKQKPTWWAHPDVVETTPQIVLSVLRQLVDSAGVRQEDIYIGDPMKNVYKHLFDYWKKEFPKVNVLGNDLLFNGLNLAALGRVRVTPTAKAVVFYSDRGTVMDEANSDKLYTIHEAAAYLINIASLKAHAAAGITLCAKNHFGSQARASAGHLHKGLVGVENDQPYRTDYGMYRVQVDLMGHALLGGNTLLYLVDGLYSAVEGWTDAYPVKWEMAPFNHDFTNSIFGSLDPVALESVCFDLLRTEYNGPEVEFNRPNMAGVDDYLRQAADSSAWPADIIYDPENDGTPISSLGVFEHWNNPVEMQYSRNLGTGNGIELMKVFHPGTAVESKNLTEPMTAFQLRQNYPNPFNAATQISYDLPAAGRVELSIFNVRGELVVDLVNANQPAGSYSVIWNGTVKNGWAPSGIYFCRIKITSSSDFFCETRKMIFQQ